MPDPLPILTAGSLPIVETILSSDWIVVVVCLAFCAFFSGLEIAFLSANKLRIELRSKHGNFTARILSRYLKNPSEFISTVLVANNLALVVYGIYMGKILNVSIGEEIIHSKLLKFTIITIISTFIVLLTGEFLPKSLFRINPDSLLHKLIIPFRLFHFILWPLIFLVKKSSSFLLRIFTRTPISESTLVFSKVDLDNYIASLENTGQAEHNDLDTEVFRNALEFSDVKVRDFMVPRTELIALAMEDTVTELKALFLETRLSKILIYRDNVDHIIGFVHHSDMLDKPDTISKVLKPVLIVNESMHAHDLLREFIQKHRSIAVVVNEFGGTAGIATIEDVIEEIFGEIEDEFDTEDLTETTLAENHFLFSARLEIDYLNEKYNLKLPEGDYTTLGGFVINISERIPMAKEIIRQEPFEFHITKSNGSRVEEIELTVHT